jgi:hypothetical protein
VSKRYLLKRMTEDESAIWKRREGGGREEEEGAVVLAIGRARSDGKAAAITRDR